jgi:fumarate reductase subunit D
VSAGHDVRGGTGRHRPRLGPDRMHGIMWAAFANAAVLVAFVVPAHILVQGVLGPLGVTPAFDRRYSTFVAAIGNPLVKIYLLVVVAAVFYLFAWRAAYVVHELGVHAKRPLWTVCFGLAAVGTATAAYLLFTLP